MKNKRLAQKVKELRKRKGFSQEELSENSRVSLRTIQRIENGETEPTGDTLKKICNALNIGPDELIDWTIVEDDGFLKAMNLSTLAFLFFPLLGILVPLIMWISKKDKIKRVDQIGKSIINFQITWTILLCLGFILNIVFMVKGFDNDGFVTIRSVISGQFRMLAFLILMYGTNIILIIVNAIKIHKGKQVFYKPSIGFLRR